ncbi:hypothetical protein ScPMuIL_003435 [Solemya velum]
MSLFARKMAPGGGENNSFDMQSDITFLGDSDSDLEQSAEDMQRAERLTSKRDKLNNQILEIVGKENEGGRPLNILLIGCPGVGKSSFINTIAAAVSGQWREYSYSGWHGGDAKPISVFTNSFPKCCNEKKFPDYKLPTLIDLAGIPNEDNDRWEELLRIILFGRLLCGESITSAYEYCEEYGVRGLCRKYSDHDEKLKVDRIVFLASATEAIPQRLIECLMKAARPMGSEKDKNTRTIPVFGVMTKIDKVDLDDTVFMKRETELIHSLGLGGAKHRYLRCANYCDDVDNGTRVDRTIPKLDNTVLRFMKQVCDPVVKVMNQDESYNKITNTPKVDRENIFRNKMINMDDSIVNFMSTALVIAVEAILVAIILHWLLRPPFEISQLTNTCASYEAYSGHFDLSGMEDLCDRKLELTSRSLTLPFIIFIIIRIGAVFLLRYLPEQMRAFYHERQ